MVTSENSTGSRPAVLSMVSATSARPSAGRFEVPAKMTSSIFCERTEVGACAPSTQAMASTTFDLPEPLGPTTTVMPGLQLQQRLVGEGLEAADLQRLQEHDAVSTLPATDGRHLGHPALHPSRRGYSDRQASSGIPGRRHRSIIESADRANPLIVRHDDRRLSRSDRRAPRRRRHLATGPRSPTSGRRPYRAARNRSVQSREPVPTGHS